MNLSNLGKILATEPKYRQKQAQEAVFIKKIDSWSEASSLPIALRETLANEVPLTINSEKIQKSGKDVAKVLIKLDDGQKIETVLIKHRDKRNTICVSSQVGCSANCSFCATGKLGFKRNLTVDEIILQVLYFARELKKTNEEVTNIVFMGMGEPFLNFDNVLAAVRIFNDKDYFNIGARKISISTCGVIDGIKKLAAVDLQLNLAISLHAPFDEMRDEIMPINQAFPIRKLMQAARDFVSATNRRVMFEYLLLPGINDTPECAEELAKLINHHLFFVNLINYNEIEGFSLPKIYQAKPSDKKISINKYNINEFKRILNKHKVKFTERYSFGGNIDAACGQLAGK